MAKTEITLASATLSGGMQLVSASGSLPDRLTVPDHFYDVLAWGAVRSLVLCNDGFIVASNAAGSTRKYLWDGSVAWTTATNGVNGLFRRDDTTIWGARNATSATYYQLVDATGAITIPTIAGATARRRVVAIPGGTTMWDQISTATLTEYTIATGAVTGRTLALGSAPGAIDASDADGTAGIYALVGNEVRKYRHSDLALTHTWTFTGTAPIASPGAHPGVEMFVAPAASAYAGRPVIRTDRGFIDVCSATTGAQALIASRLVWPGPELRGSAGPNATAGFQCLSFGSFSPDGNWFGYVTADAAQTNQCGGVRVLYVGAASAEFDYSPFNDPETIEVVVPGNLGQSYGALSGRGSGVQNHKRVSLYYQRAGVDGSPVEFEQGDDLELQIDDYAATTVTVAINSPLGIPGSPAPYIGDAAGGGVRVYYEAVAANVAPTVTFSGLSKTVILPDDSVSITAFATDPDSPFFPGPTWLWTQVSGPNTAGMSGTTTATVTVSGLIEGDYVFQAAADDGEGGTGTNTVTVNVVDAEPAPIPDDENVTTLEAIRDNHFALLRALTPERMSDRRFDHVVAERLATWADRSANAEQFRKFSWERTGAVEMPPLMAPNRVERREQCELTVAYPALTNLYGSDRHDDMEALIRQDARLIHDVLFSPDNYITGQIACFVATQPPARGDAMWTQTFTLDVLYYEAMTL